MLGQAALSPDPEHGRGCPRRPSPGPAILEPVRGRGPLASENGECALWRGSWGAKEPVGCRRALASVAWNLPPAKATVESLRLNLPLCPAGAGAALPEDQVPWL